MKELVDTYLEARESAWAESTFKSEKARLRAVAHKLDLGPKALHKYLEGEGQKPYSIKTLFIRICDMEKWANAGNAFQFYMLTHRNRFKHVYQKEELNVSWNDAISRINQLSEPYRAMALGLLQSGLRLDEAYRVRDGKVAGKGGKVRKVYGKIEDIAPRSTFSRKLKAVGLKPHTLRKLCATRLAENNASPADLCKVFGWTDIKTAYQYLQPKEESRLNELMEKSTKGP